MQGDLIRLDKVSARLGPAMVLRDISLTIRKGEQWAVLGPSGSGKTSLLRVLAGHIAHSGHMDTAWGEGWDKQVHLVEQQAAFVDKTRSHQFYYQQRFNATDAEATLTVAEILQSLTGSWDGNFGAAEAWLDAMAIRPVLTEALIQLSSGEQKRLQLLVALLKAPSLLILDQPMTGLDKDGRERLSSILRDYAAAGKHIFITCSPTEIPAWVTHLAILEGGRLVWTGPREGAGNHLEGQVRGLPDFRPLLNSSSGRQQVIPGEELVAMEEVSIQYGGKKALDRISWMVKAGEKWSVSGPNGAGKSTLLSLITADHPQAYANRIRLFGRQRGTGESIWEIKQRMGFLSAELHLFFEKGISSYQAMASGFFDTIGLFRVLSREQENILEEWFRLLGLESMAMRPLSELSLGQQRLILLARALIRNPPLLILDEPCHGLDQAQAAAILSLVDQYANHPGNTLIYVTHYAEELPDSIHHFLRLDQGRMA